MMPFCFPLWTFPPLFLFSYWKTVFLPLLFYLAHRFLFIWVSSCASAVASTLLSFLFGFIVRKSSKIFSDIAVIPDALCPLPGDDFADGLPPPPLFLLSG